MPAHTPAELHSGFVEAFNNRDLDALAALYEPGAVLFLDGKAIQGHDGIREALGGFLAMQVRITLDTRAVIESSDSLALLHAHWTLVPLGGGAAVGEGNTSEVVRRQPDGTWLYAIDNPNTPA